MVNVPIFIIQLKCRIVMFESDLPDNCVSIVDWKLISLIAFDLQENVLSKLTFLKPSIGELIVF